jgi:hypothetical protein
MGADPGGRPISHDGALCRGLGEDCRKCHFAHEKPERRIIRWITAGQGRGRIILPRSGSSRIVRCHAAKGIQSVSKRIARGLRARIPLRHQPQPGLLGTLTTAVRTVRSLPGPLARLRSAIPWSLSSVDSSADSNPVTRRRTSVHSPEPNTLISARPRTPATRVPTATDQKVGDSAVVQTGRARWWSARSSCILVA